ncbi:alpha-ribazole phosphatase [Hathewaya massiliensis]|uniref:alpha-ribazole phosphatase n=1 Tax=Hathewaya massiliensis TaxID=1964382 RepID=UPI0011585DCF|nr:alpha-ribazole phosphatase [Hathewaya massiliensis]
MNLYLVRHGYTEENSKGTYYGDIDVGLNNIGELQCKFLKEKLSEVEFSCVYTSTKKRAIQSAELILKNKEYNLIKSEKLNERSFGIFEGLDYIELEKSYKEEYKAWSKDWIGYKIKNGESHLEFSNRVYEFLEHILDKHKNQENLLLVCHGGVIRAIYTYIMNKQVDLFWKFACKNGDLAIIKYEYGNLYIDSISHNKY